LGLLGWRWGRFGSNPGSVPGEPNRFGKEYIRVVSPFLFIFIFNFSLFSYSLNYALFSLLKFFLILRRGERRRLAGPGWSETAPTQRLAVVDGGAAAPDALFYFFFSAYSLLLLPLYTFLHPKSPNTNPNSLDLKKKKGERELPFAKP